MNGPTASDDERLQLVGWYCWRCRGINARACRSDSVPMYAPASWAADMKRELGEKENEDG